jgi:hypothetical protein
LTRSSAETRPVIALMRRTIPAKIVTPPYQMLMRAKKKIMKEINVVFIVVMLYLYCCHQF